MIVPEDLRDTILGRCSVALLLSSSWREELVDVISGGGVECKEGNGCVGGEAMVMLEEWEGLMSKICCWL